MASEKLFFYVSKPFKPLKLHTFKIPKLCLFNFGGQSKVQTTYEW